MQTVFLHHENLESRKLINIKFLPKYEEEKKWLLLQSFNHSVNLTFMNLIIDTKFLFQFPNNTASQFL